MSGYEYTSDEFTCLDVASEYTPEDLGTAELTFDMTKYRVYAQDKWGRFKNNWSMMVYGGMDEWDSREEAERHIILHMLWHRVKDRKSLSPVTPDKVYQICTLRTVGVPLAAVEPILKSRVAPPQGTARPAAPPEG